MKTWVSQFIFLFFLFTMNAQTDVSDNIDPTFLIGTWKVENKNLYENWVSVADTNLLKGTGYTISNDGHHIHEYLTLSWTDSTCTYTARVVKQNNGESIHFQSSSPFSMTTDFKNNQHDFPQKINYRILSQNFIEVTVSSRDNPGFKLKLNQVTE